MRSRSKARILSTACLASIAALLVSAPAVADEPVPPVARDPARLPPESARWGVLGLGAASTAFWYGGSVGLSYAWPSAPEADKLRLPVAGPWLALAATGCPAGDPDCSTYVVVIRAVLTGLSGVGQVGGLAMMAEAAFMRTAEPAGQATAPERARQAPRRVAFEIHPMPMLGIDSVGMGLQGHF